DGLPGEIEKLDWKDRHVVGFFHEPARKLQEDYARKLLGHRNPYTRLTFAEDPAVAFVEIHNENGLIHAWLGNRLGRLPEVFLRDLRRQWNAWLARRHGSTAKLRQAWGVKEEKPGAELLANTALARSLDPWVLERHDKARGTAAASEDVPAALRRESAAARSVRVTVTQAGTEGWHIQLNHPGVKLQAERPHTLLFWARADRPMTLSAGVGQAHAPWKNLGLN